jgi:hypothetical protein
MVRMRAQYRDRDIGRVAADDVVTPDVRAPQINPALEVEPSRPVALTEEQLIDNLQMPSAAKEWLKQRPEYVFDAEQNARIRVVHNDLLREGHEPYSPSYFSEAEKRLAEPQVDRSAVDQVLAEARHSVRASEVEDIVDGDNGRLRVSPRRVQVSAPPSREVPSSNGSRDQGRITLTAEQKHFAKVAGVDEATYAFNLLKLRDRKAQGDYPGGQ